MIAGAVNADHEAIIGLKVQGPSGQEQDIDAVIDTGFTGLLTLPPTIIQALGLTWLTQSQAVLGNGQIETFDVFVATVVWDGQPIRIMVDEANTDPLVGMALMYGYDLHIQNLDGGLVTIERIVTP